MVQMLNRAMPFMAVTFMQFGFAGMSLISKFALNHGMSPHVLVVYRHAVATVFIAPFAIIFDRNVRPKMTLSIFTKIVLLGLLEPVIDQNLFYTGMKLTTATFTSAMCNVLPAFAFIMAWIFRLEKINLRSLHSLAKILGTIVTVGGAMLMTLINGPMLNFPWTRRNIHQESTVSTVHQDPIKGGLMLAAGCFCWSCFMILQAITLKSYPAELSLTTWICLVGTVQGTAAALAFEWNNPIAWSIHFDYKLLAAVYSGIMCSGIAYYIQGMVMKERGPVFVTAFSPLNMIITAVISSFILAEIMYLGRKVEDRGLRTAMSLKQKFRPYSVLVVLRTSASPGFNDQVKIPAPENLTSGEFRVVLSVWRRDASVVRTSEGVIGAMVIVIGLYMVLWGKSKDQLPSELEKDDKMELATNV